MTEEKQHDLPKVYAIWAEGKPDGPMEGRSGFLSEKNRRLIFSAPENAERKIQDMKNLRLNHHPAVGYQCVEYSGGFDTHRSIQAEQIKAVDLQPDPGPLRYEITSRIYGNTGGGCMVGTLGVCLPELEKTVWMHCNDEGVTVTSADYVWNEDHSDSWDRYEDVAMLEVNFWDDSPKDMGPLLPAIQDAIAYTIGQETAHSSELFRIPAKWLPEAYRQHTDPEYLEWAIAEDHAVEIGKEGVVINDPAYLFRTSPRETAPNPVVYIASPLSGDVEQNLQFARQACRYAIAQGVTPFAPHLLYTQMLDDGSPEERQLGIDMGNRMLELCDELWLCGDHVSPGMAGEKELAERMDVPVRSISTEEIQSVDFSPTEGMGMVMG